MVSESLLLGHPLDLILAIAAKAEKVRPRPEHVADAWVNQDQGHEAYFFENVGTGSERRRMI
jgi:hypothetical protein